MPLETNATNTALSRRRNSRMDTAMKAGIGATICSVLILTLVFLAMHTLPVSIG